MWLACLSAYSLRAVSSDVNAVVMLPICSFLVSALTTSCSSRLLTWLSSIYAFGCFKSLVTAAIGVSADLVSGAGLGASDCLKSPVASPFLSSFFLSLSLSSAFFLSLSLTSFFASLSLSSVFFFLSDLEIFVYEKYWSAKVVY